MNSANRLARLLHDGIPELNMEEVSIEISLACTNDQTQSFRFFFNELNFCLSTDTQTHFVDTFSCRIFRSISL